MRLVVLVSGAGSNLAALLQKQKTGELGARIVAVVSDRDSIAGLDTARCAGVPTAVVKPKDFDSRGAWNAALAKTVATFRPDWVVCAGFMRILGEEFLAEFGGRTINTHPALLPAFPGAHGVRDALAYGVKVTGCTVHLVDGGVDTGPIIAQGTVEVLDDDDEATLHNRIKEVERDLLAATVGRIAAHGLSVDGRKITLS